MEERDGIGDLDGGVGRGDAADQDAVGGGCGVFEGVENEFDVSVLWNLVLQIGASHASDESEESLGEKTQHTYTNVVEFLMFGLECWFGVLNTRFVTTSFYCKVKGKPRMSHDILFIYLWFGSLLMGPIRQMWEENLSATLKFNLTPHNYYNDKFFFDIIYLSNFLFLKKFSL